MQTSEPALSEAPTVNGRLSHTSDRERRRAAVSVPRLPTGRYLAMEDGEDVVIIALGEETVHLGRGRAAHVLLEHLSVSRRHAIVAKRGEDHVLLDDRSRNGVFVNGERVSEAVLRDGDAIAIGDVALRFLDVC